MTPVTLHTGDLYFKYLCEYMKKVEELEEENKFLRSETFKTIRREEYFRNLRGNIKKLTRKLEGCKKSYETAKKSLTKKNKILEEGLGSQRNSHRVLKSYESVKEHFIERVKLRYDIDIPIDSYDELCKSYQGCVKKKMMCSLGYVFYESSKIWCLFDNERKLLKTAYPKDLENNHEELLKCVFSRHLWSAALIVYRYYLNEREEMKEKKFENQKKAYLYFKANTVFPDAHTNALKGRENIFKVMCQIRSVILNRNKYGKLQVVLK